MCIRDSDWTTSTLRDTVTHQRGAYAAARWSLSDSLTLITGGRYATWQSRSPTRDQKDSRLIPYAGLVYDINSTYSAYASYTCLLYTSARAGAPARVRSLA